MNPSDLDAEIQISGGRQAGTEPWERTLTVQLDASGFRQDDQLGRGADPQGPIAAEQVARLLLAQFDRTALIALLDHVVAVRAAIASDQG